MKMKTKSKQKNIPDGWFKNQLGDVVFFFNGKGHEQCIVDDGKFVVVNSKFISTNGVVRKYSNSLLAPLKKGDVAMVMSDVPNGRAIAKCFFVDKDRGYTLNQRIGGFRSQKIIPSFLVRILDRNRYFLTFDDGVNQTNLRKEDILSCPLIYPSIPEQKRIVAVLEAWDGYLEKLARKLEIKKRIKKGLMQQLLIPLPAGQAPKKRLKGFTAAWELLKLKDIANCLDNQRVPLNSDVRQQKNGNIPYCGANGILDYIDEFIFDEDIILVAEDGGHFDEYSFRPIAYRMKEKCWVNNHAHVIKVKSSFSQDLLFYLTVHKNILKYLNGGTRAKLNKSELMDIKYAVPKSKKEQTAIANILTQADGEIEALEKKKKIIEAQKKFLLNKLVTGEIRTPEGLLKSKDGSPLSACGDDKRTKEKVHD